MSIDRSDRDLVARPRSDGSRTGTRALTVLGSLMVLGGLVAVVVGFTGLVGLIGVGYGGGDRMSVLSDDRTGMTGFPEVAAESGEDDAAGGGMALMGGGGLAVVVGLGVVAFTRIAAAQQGAYTRVTVEHGTRPGGDAAAGAVCGSCGRRNERADRYCGGCGHALV